MERLKIFENYLLQMDGEMKPRNYQVTFNVLGVLT